MHETLSDRENEILGLIAAGMTNRQIADRLYLSLDTVKWYNRQMYAKLGVHSRTQAVAHIRAHPEHADFGASHNPELPAQGTPFVGRERELLEVQRLLARPDCRLITLLGRGGIGKTRIALETARRCGDQFPDGVYYVPFAAVESPTLIASTLSRALTLAPVDERNSLEQVVQSLHDKTTLLVIDNFEHLLDGVGSLSEILDRTQGVTLLVTSRERLNLTQEWVLTVQGLGHPDDEDIADNIGALVGSDAGRLFLSTAQRTDPGFDPDEEDLISIGRICGLVGGMPLGIELAASWVRILSCTEIAVEIARGLKFLATTWRDTPERHRSMLAVLDHSWRLLDMEEQALLCKLTVFRGSLRREAAVAVTGATLRDLLGLADKSFLQHTAGGRFEIHELFRQYAGEKLSEDPDSWTAAQGNHCHYYAGFLFERMVLSEASEHLAEVEAVYEDVRAAWRYAVTNGVTGAIEQMAAGFLRYYRFQSWYRAGSEGLDLYRQALTWFLHGTTPTAQATVSRLYESLGHLHGLNSSREEMLAAFERALETAPVDETVRRGRLTGRIADAQVALNRHDRAHEFYDNAAAILEASTEHPESWWTEWLRIKIKQLELLYWQNRPEDMEEVAQQILPVLQRHGTTLQRIRGLNLLGQMMLRKERYFRSAEAVAYTHEALELCLRTGNLAEIAAVSFYHGFCLLWAEEFDEAEIHLERASQMAVRNGDFTLLARALAYLGVLHRRRDDCVHVREYAEYGLRIAQQVNMPQYTGIARAQYAWLALLDGDLGEAERQAHTAIDDWGGLAIERTAMPFRWLSLLPLMAIALSESETERAVEWARHLILPPQQRLPEELTAVIQRTLTAWEAGQGVAAENELRQTLRLAHELHYV